MRKKRRERRRKKEEEEWGKKRVRRRGGLRLLLASIQQKSRILQNNLKRMGDSDLAPPIKDKRSPHFQDAKKSP